MWVRATSAAIMWVISTSLAHADMFDLPTGRYQPTPEQRQQQARSEEYRRGAHHCFALTIFLGDDVDRWNQQVRLNSYDYSPTGWIAYDSKRIWDRDALEEMARFQEEMRAASYGHADQCPGIQARYRSYMACYHRNAMNNRSEANAACGSDLYTTYAR